MKNRILKQLVLCLMVPCFAILAGSFVSAANCADSTAQVMPETKKYKNCTVDKVKRIGADGDNAEVEFTDEAGNSHSAIVPWSSTLRRKLEKAEKNGTEVDISVNSDNQITGVR